MSDFETLDMPENFEVIPLELAFFFSFFFFFCLFKSA